MRQIKYILLLVLFMMALTSCNKATKERSLSDLSDYKTDYVGDAPSVVNIVSGLDYPQGYTYDSIEIQSKEEPYGLTVFLNVDAEAAECNLQEALKENASMTLNLIGNLEILKYKILGSDEVVATYEKDHIIK